MLWHPYLTFTDGGGSPPAPPPAAASNSGGWPEPSRKQRFRTREDIAEAIKRERIRLGILPAEAEVIESVAERQAEVIGETNAKEKAAQELALKRKIAKAEIEWEQNFAEYLAYYREMLVTEMLKEHYAKRRKRLLAFAASYLIH